MVVRILCGFLLLYSVTSCPLEPYCIRGPHGIVGGNYFSGYDFYSKDALCANITKVEAFYSGILHGTRFTYGTDKVAQIRGKQCDGCTHETYDLAVDEWIYKVNGISGQKTGGSTYRITQLTFHTNKRTLGPFGDGGEHQTAFEAIGSSDQSAGLHFIEGWAGDNIDQITFYFKCHV